MRPRSSKRLVRTSAGLVMATCLLLLLGSFIASPATPQPASEPSSDSGRQPSSTSIDSEASLIGSGRANSTNPTQPAQGITVVTTQGFYVGNHPGSRDVAEILAFSREGAMIYRDSSHQVYYDVDPVPGTKYTVEYVAADRRGSGDCGTGDRCSRNLVERANLSTGEVTTVYSAITPKFDGGRWHDVDRVNETHLVIADIVYDRVLMIDTRTGATVWQWNATERYPPDVGGGQQDWTHINDVEVLNDGRIMAGIRNMDQVVFLDPSTGSDAGWTLGSDDEYDTLHEPHNPDYITEERGGPAIVLADSENYRVIEYQRRNGSWTRAWSWRDPTLQWPRDADRLPTGHTLIVDSHGDRVVEIAADGTIVWSVPVGRPYDAERLGTGDESRSGFAAGTSPTCAAGERCGSPPQADQGATDRLGPVIHFKDTMPPVLVNSLLFLAPPWVHFTDLVVGGLLILTTAVWGATEWVWSDHTLVGLVSRFRSSFR